MFICTSFPIPLGSKKEKKANQKSGHKKTWDLKLKNIEIAFSRVNDNLYLNFDKIKIFRMKMLEKNNYFSLYDQTMEAIE